MTGISGFGSGSTTVWSVPENSEWKHPNGASTSLCVLYGDHHVFMLCDLKMLKAHGEQQFIHADYEGFRLPDDASIVYTDFSKWSALKLIQCRRVGG